MYQITILYQGNAEVAYAEGSDYAETVTEALNDAMSGIYSTGADDLTIRAIKEGHCAVIETPASLWFDLVG